MTLFTAALLIILLSMPLCASLAGTVVWVAHRNETADDRELLRTFLGALIVAMAILWSISRTDAVRMRLNPQLRVEAEIKKNAVYAAVEQFAPSDGKTLWAFLGSRKARGETLPQALLEARTFLTQTVNERLGFADQKSRLAWGRVTVDTLEELQARDPALCYRFMATQTLDEQESIHALSAENTASFQAAVIQLFQAINAGMQRRGLAPGDVRVEFNDAAREFSAIQTDIEQEFGKPAADVVGHKKLPLKPAVSADLACSARIFQLHAILKRPQGNAAMMIDSVLR
jgi:hypothetical protein